MSEPRVRPVLATRLQVARDHARFTEQDPNVFVSTALRTKSVHSREILAELAWPGHTPEDLTRWLTGGDPWPVLGPDMAAGWVASYGQVLALQTGLPEERAQGRAALEAVHATGVLAELRPRCLELLLQLRVADRDRTAALDLVGHEAIRPPMAAAVAADLTNPALFPGDGLDEREWLATLHTALEGGDLAPLSLEPQPEGEDLPPFDRLTCPDLEPVPSPARVTVLMSTFRPGPPLLTAVRSLARQTWTDLEILVIDDASGEDYRSVLDRAAALDPRVRVIRKTVNGGTYRARNTGMRQATGRFLTVLDSDDWLHPQAIERSVQLLLAKPGLMATRGQGVRVSEDLELNRPGYLPRVTSAPSLMIRVDPVVDRIGYFDPTSKSADTEYATRIAAAFGGRVRDIPAVMTFLRGGDTLSSSEFSRGWRHGARHAYKCAYRPWHQRIKAGETQPFLDPTGPRLFPEPRRWAKPAAPDLAPPPHFDLCLAGDWRRFGGPQRSMLEELAAARAAGLRVCVMHLEAFRFMTTKDDPLCAAILELVNNGEVEWIHPDDDVDIDVLLIRYPPILQYPPARGRSVVRARQVLIMANQAPLEPDGSDQRYVVSDVTERTRELFGREPLWVPQGPTIRRVLREQDPDVRMTTWDNLGLIDPTQWQVRDRGTPTIGEGPVVIGRYSRDDVLKFAPTLAEIRRGYTFGRGYEIRMMGARSTLRRLAADEGLGLEDLPEEWVVMRHKQIEVTEFLAGLDFFLYLDNPHMHEAFGRTLLEAAASGVLTIAHPKHRDTFGEVLDYALPGEAQALIARYVADPEAYAERVTRTQRLVAEQFGHQRFVARLAELAADLGEPVDRPDPVTETGPREPAGGPLDLRVRPAVQSPARATGPVEVQVADGPWELRTVPIRSVADAEQLDLLAVVHQAGAQEQVRSWLREGLADFGPDGTQGVTERLLAQVPPSVPVVLSVREGVAELLWDEPGDTPATLDPPARTVPTDLPAPQGWRSVAWVARTGPVALRVPAAAGAGSAQSLPAG